MLRRRFSGFEYVAPVFPAFREASSGARVSPEPACLRAELLDPPWLGWSLWGYRDKDGLGAALDAPPVWPPRCPVWLGCSGGSCLQTWGRAAASLGDPSLPADVCFLYVSLLTKCPSRQKALSCVSLNE